MTKSQSLSLSSFLEPSVNQTDRKAQQYDTTLFFYTTRTKRNVICLGKQLAVMNFTRAIHQFEALAKGVFLD